MTIITRFAPSPTNNLHLGHVYSARLAREFAKQQGGEFVLRIEDIDHIRCKPEYTAQLIDDLTWLGLSWDGDMRVQSKHLGDYQAVIEKLDAMGVIYPCFCTKKEIMAEIERAGQAPHQGEHIPYPQTCRGIEKSVADQMKQGGIPYALRLDMARAIEIVGRDVTWVDGVRGVQTANTDHIGDIVIARKDIGTSYHISAVHDDYLQGVTHIIRGVDLFETTDIHRVLQALLGYPTPTYHHHGLLVDLTTGYRLAKRDNAATIKSMRDAGMTAQDILNLVDQYALKMSDGSN